MQYQNNKFNLGKITVSTREMNIAFVVGRIDNVHT